MTKKQKAILNYLKENLPGDAIINQVSFDTLSIEINGQVKAIHTLSNIYIMANYSKFKDVDPILDHKFNKSTKIEF